MTDFRTVVCSGREIRWILTRKRVKNLNLRIKPDGFVYVSANSRVTIAHIEDFIREKSDFILDALDRYETKSMEPQLPLADEIYENGDTFSYFGEYYTLRIEISPKEAVFLHNKEIIVRTKNEEHVGKLLEKFYKDSTEALFQSLNKRTCEMFRAKGYDVPLAELQIRKMTSRWGSCHYTKGKIVMNSRLALYPEMCAAYVFIHEYAHFTFPDHSKNFYAVVGQLMPDYKICVNILKY
ncbi:MAG: M48 family metallopeptidase [Oscillospiraceae bacterium]|nr:M48 family metallopeptidase [Oscillospiraceae bacterium]